MASFVLTLNTATAHRSCLAYGTGEAGEEQRRERPCQYPQDLADNAQPSRGHTARIRGQVAVHPGHAGAHRQVEIQSHAYLLNHRARPAGGRRLTGLRQRTMRAELIRK